MILIGIAGGSGTGKTSVVDIIIDKYFENAIAISLDSYYNDNSHLSPEERKKLNFDHPSAFDYDLLHKHLNLLKKSKIILKPTYSYIERTRQQETLKVYPSELFFIEGILLYFDDRITNLFDYRFYIDLDEMDRLDNIIKRDVKDRGRDPGEITKRFYEEVNPMHKKYVESQKNKVNYVINCRDLNETGAIIYNQLKSVNLC